MKKNRLFIFQIFVFILFTCFGCGNKQEAQETKLFDIARSDVTKIEVYEIPAPAFAEKKEVTEPQDIDTIVNGLNSFQVIENEETGVGGWNLFVLHLTDGNELIIGYNFTSVWNSDGRYEIQSEDVLYEIWDKLDYPTVSVAEDDIPIP